MEEKKYLTLEQVHEEQTKMLKILNDFCNQENITYYICGGTLLGAIRHKGFIPWDDDVDILMPRPDYEKFHKIMEERGFKIQDNIIFRSFKYKNLLIPFAKILNTDLKMEEHYYDTRDDSYLWIDIFPMDGIPESENKTKKLYKKILFLRRLLSLIKVKDDIIENESKSKLMIIPKKIVRFFLSNRFVINRILKKMDKTAKKYDFETSKYVGGVLWGYGPQEKLLKSELTNIEVEFENLKVNTFSCYHKYLTNLYKDYMQLPPAEKRVAHGIKVSRISK